MTTRDPDSTFLAMDVGGTSVKQGLVDRRGRVLASRVFPTLSSRPQQALIDDMLRNLRGLVGEAPDSHKPLALALGMPGWLDQKAGMLVRAPNMPGWANVPIARILSEELKMPAHLENDANLYALGEWLGGAARGLTNCITMTLGTGVGGGLILENRIWNGSFASAGEVGHMPLAEDGPLCGCGNPACLETTSAATGMIRMAREWLAAGQPTLYEGPPADVTPLIMHGLALQGDPMSQYVYMRAGRGLGLVLASIFNLLGLEGVVLGGGVSAAFDLLYPHLYEVFSRRLVTARPSEIRIVPGELGGDAPLAGAAALLTHYGY